jgi:hypothetical protein
MELQIYLLHYFIKCANNQNSSFSLLQINMLLMVWTLFQLVRFQQTTIVKRQNSVQGVVFKPKP